MTKPKAPERIYLQLDEGCFDEDDEDAETFNETYANFAGITWCTERINDSDAEYISIDALIKFIEKIKSEEDYGSLIDDAHYQGKFYALDELIGLISVVR